MDIHVHPTCADGAPCNPLMEGIRFRLTVLKPPSFKTLPRQLAVHRSNQRNWWSPPRAPTHLRRLQTPLMPGSSTAACSITPMPFRTMRSEPSMPAPEQVTTWQAGRQGGRKGRKAYSSETHRCVHRAESRQCHCTTRYLLADTLGGR